MKDATASAVRNINDIQDYVVSFHHMSYSKHRFHNVLNYGLSNLPDGAGQSSSPY